MIKTLGTFLLALTALSLLAVLDQMQFSELVQSLLGYL
jgi:hypothetical protein